MLLLNWQRYKASARGPILRTDIQVADDTGSYFRVCLWQKQMWSMVSAGDVVLLQSISNVPHLLKIVLHHNDSHFICMPIIALTP